MAAVRKAWELILDIFFPPVCLNCRRCLENAEKPNQICAACFNGIELNKTLFYPSPDFILGAAASYEDEAVKNLIHYFKYNYLLNLQKPLSILLIKYLERLNLDLQNFVIIPVPLHKSKFKTRGFNQSEILAEIVSNELGLVLDKKLLIRIKNTKPQIETKNYKEREVNIKNAFEVLDKNAIRNKNIVLVDDVYTSGATMHEVVRTLRRAGAGRIIGVVVAKTG